MFLFPEKYKMKIYQTYTALSFLEKIVLLKEPGLKTRLFLCAFDNKLHLLQIFLSQNQKIAHYILRTIIL